MNRCLKRLIGLSTSVVFKSTHSFNTSVCNSYHFNKTTTLLSPRFAFATSFASSSQGLGNEVGIYTKTLHPQSGRCDEDIDIVASEEDKQQLKIIEKGDVVNLSDLLFTENRDYLIRYGDPQPVTADDLAGKVVVICFVQEDPYSASSTSNTFIPSLIDVYNDLKHKNCFEVVFVFLGDAFPRREKQIYYLLILICGPKLVDDINILFCVEGLGNEVGIYTKTLHPQSGRCDEDIDIVASEEDKQQLKIIEKGDVVNLSDLLFTENRDYLIRYGDPQPVTADDLAGKVVVICFVQEDPYSASSTSNTFIPSLIDVYNDLKHKNCFEVVFVFLGDAFPRREKLIYRMPSSQSESQTRWFPQSESRCDHQIFEDIFSRMPWTAIPFSDITLRKNLGKKFGFKNYSDYAGSVIDSTGKVLQTHCCQRFIDKYGSPAYPFSDERIAFLDSEDKIIAKQPSLKSLLVSPQRDYVISNKGEKVPVHTLEDKVVALYFFEDDNSHYNPTKELITAYEELAKSNGNFEVVLIYLSDVKNTYKYTNEETFRNTFKSMPWLALPFKDPIQKRLKRLFRYPPLDGWSRQGKAPSLVIYGPHGEFIEPCGAELLLGYGVSAYPFTRENLVKLETVNVMELTLEMLCPTTVFWRKNGSQVQSSHFVGKRVMFYFESSYWDHAEDLVTFKDKVKFVNILKEVEFLTMLKERYLRMKGTDHEFEVIYIPSYYIYDKFCFTELVADLPWFVSPLYQWDDGPNSVFLTYYGNSYPTYKWPFLLAFGEDGRLVRRTICPKVTHEDFPFYAGSLEEEAYYKLSRHVFGDGYWYMYYVGLLRNSFYTK